MFLILQRLTDSKTYMKIKSNKEAKTILKKINKFGGSKLPDIKYIIKLWELKHCGIGTRLANVE